MTNVLFLSFRLINRHPRLGIAAIFALAEQYNTTTGVINNLTSKWVLDTGAYTRISNSLFVVGVSSCSVRHRQDPQTLALTCFRAGWGGIFAVMLMRRYGRLPILFWSQVLALGFMAGCTFAPTLKTFTGMSYLRLIIYWTAYLVFFLFSAFRCLTAFFG